MKKTLLILTLLLISALLLVSNLIIGQNMGPLELVKKVFSDSQFLSEIPKYSMGEYDGKPNSQDIESNTKMSFKVLEENDKTAVINLTLIDSLDKGIDTYIHLTNKNRWKINAFRALAMTGILEEIKNQFETMTDEQIDTLILSGDERIKSKADFYRELNNIKLTLDLDDSIMSHFLENQEAFQNIVQEISDSNINEKDSEMKTVNLDEHIRTDYKSLLISSVSSSFYCENCFEFVIGGMIDNSVGYLYIPNEKDVPKMTPSRLIMIRKIKNGWYLFKTT